MGLRWRGRVLVTGDDDGYGATLANALARLGQNAEAVDPAELDDALRAPTDAAIVIAESFRAGQGRGSTSSCTAVGVPFLVVLHTDRLADRLAAFEAGADDVIIRPVAMPELEARLRVVYRRNVPERTVLEAGDLTVDVRAHLVARGGTEVELTSLEFSLLCFLVRNRGSVLSKGQLLEVIWGPDQVDENVVEVHISALRRKLEQHGPRLIHTVRGAGYVLRSPQDEPSIRLVVG